MTLSPPPEAAAAAARVRAQLEFWSSDANLRRDPHLRKLSAAGGGYVPLTVLASFGRLRALGATPEAVAGAVAWSALVELDAAGRALRRRAPVDMCSDAWRARTVVARRFPLSAGGGGVWIFCSGVYAHARRSSTGGRPAAATAKGTRTRKSFDAHARTRNAARSPATARNNARPSRGFPCRNSHRRPPKVSPHLQRVTIGWRHIL